MKNQGKGLAVKQLSSLAEECKASLVPAISVGWRRGVVTLLSGTAHVTNVADLDIFFCGSGFRFSVLCGFGIPPYEVKKLSYILYH